MIDGDLGVLIQHSKLASFCIGILALPKKCARIDKNDAIEK